MYFTVPPALIAQVLLVNLEIRRSAEWIVDPVLAEIAVR